MLDLAGGAIDGAIDGVDGLSGVDGTAFPGQATPVKAGETGSLIVSDSFVTLLSRF